MGDVPYGDVHRSLSPFRQTLQVYSLRIRMILLFLSSVTVMIGHHLFCHFLNFRPTARPFESDSANFIIINYYQSIGNSFAVVAKAFICMALVIVFAQVFWTQSSRRRFTIEQIDENLSCKDSPVSALKSIRSTLWLSILSLLGVAMVAITIFAPGSLKPQFIGVSQDCTVLTVDLTNASIATTGNGNLYENPIAQLRGFVAQVLMANTSLPPSMNFSLTQDISYTVSFDAPHLNCTDISSAVNFTRILPDPTTADSEVVVWNAVQDTIDGEMVLSVATRSLVPTYDDNFGTKPGDSVAVSCSPYLARYFVEVNSGSGDNSSPYADQINVTRLGPLSNSSHNNTIIQSYAIADAFARLFNGTVTYDPSSFDFLADSPLVAYSPLGASNADSPWFPSGNLAEFLPYVMSSISLSVLSDFLSLTDAPSTNLVQTTCQNSDVFFIYQPFRLFLAYGVALFVGAVCIAFGFYAIHINGAEESLAFSRILQSFPLERRIMDEKAMGSGLCLPSTDFLEAQRRADDGY